MRDDYLWDRSGRPDPEVQRLERLLGTLRHSSSFPIEGFATGALTPAEPPRPPVHRPLAHLAMAATLIGAVGLGWYVASTAVPAPAWEVATLEGTPRVGSRTIAGQGRLPVGQWLVTDEDDRARLTVGEAGDGEIGSVEVEPDSRLRLSEAGTGAYRLRLDRGVMHALIWAPPGQLQVDTPSSTAIDLGCAYTLRVADDGSGLVEVTSGWVGFEWKGRESFIPAGAVCATRPGIGPGTPHYATVTPDLEAAIARFDFEARDPAGRAAALDVILAEAQPADALTLWHLVQRADPGDRDRVFDRLAAFVPPPDGVTREGVRAGNREMTDRWWEALGLGSMELWRTWQQRWRDRAAPLDATAR